jgi:hypothetical protein
VLGALVIAVAAVVVLVAALSAVGQSGTFYVIAARPMPAGTVIGPGDTTTIRVGLPGGSRDSAFRQSAMVVGRALAVPVASGELIQSSMLTPAGGLELRPVSIAVEADSVSELQAGDPVDALSVPSSTGATSGATPVVTVVVRGATLLSVDRSGGGLLSGASSGTVFATLGVANLGEAEQLVAAAHSGTVDLVRAEPGDGTGPGSAT